MNMNIREVTLYDLMQPGTVYDIIYCSCYNDTEFGEKSNTLFYFFARVDVYTCTSVNRHYTTQNIVLQLQIEKINGCE